ncbi:hypothetical protein MTR67_003816 [Solanum verrucosum]|uniref:Peptidase A1 domain-containing protein n=1 Tax=Solanum verrucosum TaxID=315347 RepID=A0AAF0T9P3_SOLVR|nr:probable aspartic proteinase GIP2 [Solanum verrucosum]WMV10431.1 hypothetical protein MTR67_003816 [Solanum verrucosum]
MLTSKFSSSSNIYSTFILLSLLLNIISLCSSIVLPTTLILPVTKDSSTLQYITVIGQRTPLIPVNFTVHLGSASLLVDCESGYNSSTYKPVLCESKQCSFAKAEYNACGSLCLSKPRPGCNNNTCHTLDGNPITDTYTGAELAEDVLAIGSKPVVLVSQPKFIFTCIRSFIMTHLAKGVTGIAGFGHNSTISIPNQLASLDSKFTNKFGICLSSSTTRSSGVIFIGSTPYYVYNPMIDISKNLVYTPLVKNTFTTSKFSEYHVKVSSIQIAGKNVPLNKTLLSIKKGLGGTRISTTTAFTILHTTIYDVVKTAFINALPKNVTIVEPPTKQFGLCFSSKNIRNTNVGPDVPVIDIVFHKKSAFWRIYGANSVVQVNKDVMCLAFVGQDQTRAPSIEIGGYQLEENLLIFDLPQKKIGFSSSLKLQQTSCSKYEKTS